MTLPGKQEIIEVQKEEIRRQEEREIKVEPLPDVPTGPNEPTRTPDKTPDQPDKVPA